MRLSTTLYVLFVLAASVQVGVAQQPNPNSPEPKRGPPQSVYEVELRRSELSKAAGDLKNYSIWLDTLNRSVQANQDQLKRSQPALNQETNDIAAFLNELNRVLSVAKPSEAERNKNLASLHAHARKRSAQPYSAKRVHNLRELYSLTSYANSITGTPQGGSGDILAYIAAIRVPDLELRIKQILDEGDKKISELSGPDPCYEIYDHFADLLSSGAALEVDQLKQKGADCAKGLQARAGTLSEYYGLVNNGFSQISNALKASQARVRDDTEKIQIALEELSGHEVRLDREARKDKTLIDSMTFWVIGLTLAAWMAILVIVVFAIIRLGQKDPQQGAGQSAGQSFNYVLFLEMMTVFILTVTILILGLAGRLQNEALAALIGGISGYVLGRIHSSPAQARQ